MFLFDYSAVMNHIEFEFHPCSLCHNKRRETSYKQFGEHKIMRCQDCQVHYLYPRLTESAMTVALYGGVPY